MVWHTLLACAENIHGKVDEEYVKFSSPAALTIRSVRRLLYDLPTTEPIEQHIHSAKPACGPNESARKLDSRKRREHRELQEMPARQNTPLRALARQRRHSVDQIVLRYFKS